MANTLKDVGTVTAYAYAVAGGYVGTKEEFEEALANASITVQELENLSAIAVTLAPGSEATASYSDGVLTFGIPQGATGETGQTGPQGPEGPTGNGIVSITKTGTSGLIDTYTITFTDGTTTTFTVTNGADGDITNVAAAFSTTKAYSVGDMVLYQGTLYAFTAAHSASAWVGSDAQAVILSDEVTALKSDLNVTETYIIGSQNLLNYTDWTTGAYIQTDGSITQNADGKYSGLIVVDEGKTYKLIGNMTRTDLPIRVLGYQSNGDFYGLLTTISGTPSGVRTVEFTVPSSVAQIRISLVVNTVQGLVLAETISDMISDMESEFNQEIDALNAAIQLEGIFKKIAGFSGVTTYSGYVNSSGEIVDNATGWIRSDYIPTGHGAPVTASLKGYLNNPVVAFFDANKQYLSEASILSNSQLIVNVDSFVPSGVAFVIFASQTNYDGRLFEIGTPATISEAIGVISDDNTPYKGINVVCLGDSLTAGRDGLGNILVHNYPYYMQKTSLKDCNIENLGLVGSTTKTYWDSHKEDIDVDTNTDLVLCMWGTNGGLVSTGALATDVEPYDDYEDYADTGVGCYCKIIEYIMELSQNHAQIILITPPYNGDSTINDRVINAQPVVKQIAERYNLPVIDMFKCGIGKFNFSTFMPDDSVHLNEAGYRWIGTYIGNCVNAISAYKVVL